MSMAAMSWRSSVAVMGCCYDLFRKLEPRQWPTGGTHRLGWWQHQDDAIRLHHGSEANVSGQTLTGLLVAFSRQPHACRKLCKHF